MKKYTFFVSCCSLLPIFAYADADTNTSDKITVTANRYQQNQLDTISDIYVFTKDDISNTQALSVVDVIKRLPSIQVASNGGFMQNQSLFIRGLNTKYTLILLDGVRVSSASTGLTSLVSLPLSQIERIEVLTGPRAAVYGADAVAGVINIITATNTKGFNADVNYTYGSYNYNMASAGVSYGNDKYWFKFAATNTDTTGFNIQPYSTYPPDKDKDGGDVSQFLASFGVNFTQNLNLKVNGYYNKAKTDYDGSYTNQTKVNLYNFASILNYHANKFQTSLTVATSQDESEDLLNGKLITGYTTVRNSVNLFGQYNLNQKSDLGLGIDWNSENIGDSYSKEQFSRDHNSNTGIYTFIKHKFNKLLTAEANVRFDANENYGDYTTWQLGLLWQLKDNLYITTSSGTAFKAPTLGDMYNTAWNTNNTELKTEHSKNYEISINGQQDLFDWKILGYYNYLNNMIAYRATGDFTGKYYNIDNVTIKGLEFGVNFTTGVIDHKLVYDYLDAKDSTGAPLILRSKDTFKWDLAYQYDKWYTNLDVIYQGTRYDNAYDADFNPIKVKLSAYTLIDLAVKYKFMPNFSIQGSIKNLLDKNYETAYQYATAERSYFVGINYKY